NANALDLLLAIGGVIRDVVGPLIALGRHIPQLEQMFGPCRLATTSDSSGPALRRPLAPSHAARGTEGAQASPRARTAPPAPNAGRERGCGTPRRRRALRRRSHRESREAGHRDARGSGRRGPEDRRRDLRAPGAPE